MSPLTFYTFSNHEYISVVLNSINIYVNKYALTPVVIHVVTYVTIDYACKNGQHIHFFQNIFNTKWVQSLLLF